MRAGLVSFIAPTTLGELVTCRDASVRLHQRVRVPGTGARGLISSAPSSNLTFTSTSYPLSQYFILPHTHFLPPTMIDFTLDEAIAVFDTQTTIVFLITLCSFFIPVLLLFPPVPIRISEALAQTHTKLGLEPGTTNLPTPPTTGKQPAEATAKDAAKDKSSLAKIQSLFIYPIKSCQGIELQKAKVFGSGLQYDRLYTFARLKDASAATGAGPSDAAKEGEGGEDAGPVWDFVTQRQFPRLAKVGVDIWCPDAVKTRGKLTERGSDETFMIVRFPWSRPGFLGIVDHVAARFSKGWSGYPEKEILLPVSFPSEPEIAGRGYRYEKVRVWREVMTALNMEEELPRDLAEYLGINERLGIFRTSPMMSREVHRNAPNADEAGYQPTVRFQDSVSANKRKRKNRKKKKKPLFMVARKLTGIDISGQYPIHLMNIASVEDMATKIEDPTLKDLSVRRFRANVVSTWFPSPSFLRSDLTSPIQLEI